MIVADVYRGMGDASLRIGWSKAQKVSLGTRTIKIGIRAPNKPPVVVSLLLAILALIAYFVNTPAAFWIAMLAYIVGALAVLVEI
jgi:hypothetical protein